MDRPMGPPPPTAEVWRTYGRIGLLSFGGPAAQIALMHRVLVTEKRWLDETAFLDALAFCTLLPGPEAMQLATYTGWRRHGVRGGLIAGGLFVLPGALVIFALAAVYAVHGQAPAVAALFLGVQAAVVVIVVEALLRVARRALVRRSHWVLAGLAFLALFVFALPFPLVVLAAGLWGLARPDPDAKPAAAPPRVAPSCTLATVALWGGLWLAPLLALGLLPGAERLAALGAFFAQLAVVTFGGAYAVLAWMAQDVVEAQGWLTAAEMVDALGLAETTPGPLILVTQFVAILAAWDTGGPLYGLAGGVVALWATFLPCFLWIFAGAPYLDWISGQPRLRGALGAITAAVVGVILNLSLWFALHVLFGDVARPAWGPIRPWVPDVTTLAPGVALLTGLAALLLLRRGWGVAATLAVTALAGLGLGALDLLPTRG